MDKISTHARIRAVSTVKVYKRVDDVFQPTPTYGRYPRRIEVTMVLEKISTHARVRAVSTVPPRIFNTGVNFNPRPRTGGIDHQIKADVRLHDFNPRPRTGGIRKCSKLHSHSYISTHALVRAVSRVIFKCSITSVISTHALVRAVFQNNTQATVTITLQPTPAYERHQMITPLTVDAAKFNPRPRTDGIIKNITKDCNKKNSTHAHERAVSMYRMYRCKPDLRISTHARVRAVSAKAPKHTT